MNKTINTKKLLLCISIIGYLLATLSASAMPRTNRNLLVPGKTIANMQLQADVLPVIYGYAIAKLPDCPSASVINSQVTQPPTDITSRNGIIVSGHWSEVWTVSACNQSVDVPVTFIADTSGTTWVIQ